MTDGADGTVSEGALARVYQSPVVQSALAAGTSMLAAVCPPLSVAVAGVSATVGAAVSNYSSDQTQSLIDDLRNRIAKLESVGKLSYERLASEQWNAEAVRAVIANAQDGREKTEHYAALLAGAASDEVAELDVDAILHCLSQLPVTAIVIARRMVEEYRSNEQARGYGVVPPGDIPNSRFYAKQLEGIGLISEVLEGDNTIRQVLNNRFELSPVLFGLIELLEAGSG